jgi:hypothetical protein
MAGAVLAAATVLLASAACAPAQQAPAPIATASASAQACPNYWPRCHDNIVRDTSGDVPTPAATAPAAPAPTVAPVEVPAPVAPAAVWERYGPLPKDLSYITDDVIVSLGQMACADVRAGHVDQGWLHGFLTGGNAPEYIKPIALNVYLVARSLDKTCPDLSAELVTLLDAYDVANAPY